MKKQEFILLHNKQMYNFKIIGFDDKKAYGELYFTENDRKTSIFRGSDMIEVIKLAKKEIRSYQGI
jgi:hypothetical protein